MSQTLISPATVSGTDIAGRRLADEKMRQMRTPSPVSPQVQEPTLPVSSAPENPRVAALKKAIADGRYALDAEAIAEGMVQVERQLGE